MIQNVDTCGLQFISQVTTSRHFPKCLQIFFVRVSKNDNITLPSSQAQSLNLPMASITYKKIPKFYCWVDKGLNEGGSVLSNVISCHTYHILTPASSASNHTTPLVSFGTPRPLFFVLFPLWGMPLLPLAVW